MAVHDDEVALPCLTGLQFSNLHRALVARLERRLLGANLADAADVERAHRQLRAGLADRLRGDDADRFADVDDVAAREVAAVAQDADAAAGLAGEHRADLHLVDAGRRRSRLTLSSSISSLLPTSTSPVYGSTTSSSADAAEDAVAELLDDLAALDERRHLDALDACRSRSRR